MTTVGDIRKAIEGLPDEAGVMLWLNETEESEGSALVELKGFIPQGARVNILLDVTAFDCLDDDDYDDDEEDPHGTEGL